MEHSSIRLHLFQILDPQRNYNKHGFNFLKFKHRINLNSIKYVAFPTILMIITISDTKIKSYAKTSYICPIIKYLIWVIRSFASENIITFD